MIGIASMFEVLCSRDPAQPARNGLVEHLTGFADQLEAVVKASPHESVLDCPCGGTIVRIDLGELEILPEPGSASRPLNRPTWNLV